MNQEQWQELVSLYGGLAYLMCEIKAQEHKGGGRVFWVVSASNDDFGNWVMRRKQSAALPFDLVAALAGDDVQAHTEGVWQDCSVIFDNDGNWTALGKGFWTSGGVEDYQFLRMKHPRLNDPDRYSKFEVKV